MSKTMSFSFLDSNSPSKSSRELPLSAFPSPLEQTPVYQQMGNTSSQNSGMNDCKDNSSVEKSERNKNPVEFFVSSDGSAILGHTNRVIYLEVI